MSSKPCLIFNNYFVMRPNDGGPAGFLAQNLLGHESEYYHLGQCHGEPPRSGWQRFRQGYLHYDKTQTLKKMGTQPGSHFGPWMLSARHTFLRENARGYPWIWFHDIWGMAACIDLIRPDQKIILQSHCPELPSEEATGLGIEPSEVKMIQAAEGRVFARADVYVFPNAGAQGIYTSLLNPEARIEYLLSGSHKLTARHSLPLDPKHIFYLYIGRRNAVKGFDIIIEAFKQAYQKDSTLRLLLVGGGEPVQLPGVIDLGRSEEPGNWIAACDYFISANRQSYFDLSVMEALSLGTPLIIASTGGHQYFGKLVSPGITAIAKANSDLLTETMLLNRKKRCDNQLAADANQQLHEKQLSSEKYRLRLDQMLRQLLA
jgi:glycosyltransferase involved in cell wall biosynthesis